MKTITVWYGMEINYIVYFGFSFYQYLKEEYSKYTKIIISSF